MPADPKSRKGIRRSTIGLITRGNKMKVPDPNANYWYINTTQGGYTADDENAEKLRNAMERGLGAVEINTLIGMTIVINPAHVSALEESTAELRDIIYQWNKAIDEQHNERKRRFGTAETFE